MSEHTQRRSDAPWKLPAPTSRAEYNERVLCLCALHAMSVTSSVRTKDRNAAVGGAEESKHLLEFGGWADDLVADVTLGIPLDSSERTTIVRDARAFGLWCVDEGTHFHVQGKALGP